jgi:hypothetical protein
MRKALIVALFAPVFALPLSYVTAGSREEAPLVASAVDNPELAPLCWSPSFTYTYVPAGPRIIQCPIQARCRQSLSPAPKT